MVYVSALVVVAITVDPENVKFILSTEFPSFEKGEKFHDMFESFWGEGIFTTDGEPWKMHRANARPFFAQERLSNFTSFERHMDKVLDIMEGMDGTGQAFDIQVSLTL
jgi:cytochrome P450